MGIPNGGWRPWLMRELAKQGVYACSLPMPSPNDPKKDEWVSEISRSVGEPNEEVFLVGHSLGTPAILKYLETLPEGKKVGGAVLISGPIKNNQDEYFDKINSFFEGQFDFNHIKKVCNKFFVIHGSNDSVVPFEEAETISKLLSCELINIHNGGHLNGESGFYELPEALEALENMLK